MTHSGGQSRANIGGQGLRYEIHANGFPNDGDNIIGWTNDAERAERMADAARKAPGCLESTIVDRQKDQRPT